MGYTVYMEHEHDFRHIASEWHGGQWSALYAFASTGTVTHGLCGEILRCVSAAKKTVPPHPPEDISALIDFADWAGEQEEKLSDES